jgi:hypothetical protein
VINRRPHTRLIFIAVWSGRVRIGIRNVSATISFVAKVAKVASQTCLCFIFFEVSCEMWMPNASENASAIAIVSIPPMTASLREVAAFSPIMTPSVVMTPEVRPNAIPVLWEEFIGFHKRLLFNNVLKWSVIIFIKDICFAVLWIYCLSQ